MTNEALDLNSSNRGITMKDGSKKKYTKEVAIDVRTGGVKPKKKE